MTASSASAACRHDHLVDFYESDGALVDSVVAFLTPALGDGDGAVVIVATPEHRAAFEEAFDAAAIDVGAAVGAGRYMAADAAGLLDAFMAGGAPDPERFRAAIEPLLDSAAAGGRRLRVYGELVALLLAAGDVASTIAVEDLWNELSSTRDFELLCGYPAQTAGDREQPPARSICERHTAVVPSTASALHSDIRAQQQLVTRLRREEQTLRAELGRLRSEQAALIELAYHDVVTGLANRRAFDDQLDREWALTARGGSDSFVVIADLNDFKRLNDTLGHAAGDSALRHFADVLRGAARQTDVLARIGGDEFGIILVRCDEHAAHAFRQRLEGALAEHGGSLGVSLGHASLRHSSSPATAVDRADLSMLALKRARRRRLGVPARRA